MVDEEGAVLVPGRAAVDDDVVVVPGRAVDDDMVLVPGRELDEVPEVLPVEGRLITVPEVELVVEGRLPDDDDDMDEAGRLVDEVVLGRVVEEELLAEELLDVNGRDVVLLELVLVTGRALLLLVELLGRVIDVLLLDVVPVEDRNGAVELVDVEGRETLLVVDVEEVAGRDVLALVDVVGFPAVDDTNGRAVLLGGNAGTTGVGGINFFSNIP